MSRFSGCARFPRLASHLCLLLLLSYPCRQVQADSTAAGEVCWGAKSLEATEAEIAIHKGVREAFVRPPGGVPFTFDAVPPSLRGAVRRVQMPPDKKLVALTIDMCEQPHEVSGYQGSIFDFLRAEKVKATLFLGGKWMLTHQERAQQLIADPLFEIGNHTWEHRNLRIQSRGILDQEIKAPLSAFAIIKRELQARQCLARDGRTPAQQIPPEKLRLFRFPYGACNKVSLDAVNKSGMIAIQWDVSSGDPWKGQTPERMVKAVLEHVRPGSIILFHANGRGWHTSRGLPQIVKRLRQAGYEFATVSELLKAGKPEVVQQCYDEKPGDTDRYDALARKLEVIYSESKSTGGDGGPEAYKGLSPAVPESPPGEEPEVLPWQVR